MPVSCQPSPGGSQGQKVTFLSLFLLFFTLMFMLLTPASTVSASSSFLVLSSTSNSSKKIPKFHLWLIFSKNTFIWVISHMLSCNKAFYPFYLLPIYEKISFSLPYTEDVFQHWTTKCCWSNPDTGVFLAEHTWFWLQILWYFKRLELSLCHSFYNTSHAFHYLIC